MMKKTSMIAIVMAILLPFSADITTNNTADAVPLNAKIGIKPDIEVKNPEGTDSADLQLNRAIEELIK